MEKFSHLSGGGSETWKTRTWTSHHLDDKAGGKDFIDELLHSACLRKFMVEKGLQWTVPPISRVCTLAPQTHQWLWGSRVWVMSTSSWYHHDWPMARRTPQCNSTRSPYFGAIFMFHQTCVENPPIVRTSFNIRSSKLAGAWPMDVRTICSCPATSHEPATFFSWTIVAVVCLQPFKFSSFTVEKIKIYQNQERRWLGAFDTMIRYDQKPGKKAQRTRKQKWRHHSSQQSASSDMATAVQMDGTSMKRVQPAAEAPAAVFRA